MKVLLPGMLLIFALSAFGGEQCSLQAKRVTYLNNEKVSSSCSSNWGRPLEFKVDSWQDCYEKALAYASKNPFFIYTEGFNITIGGFSSCPNVSGHFRDAVFVEWQYDDNLFLDSEGRVTKFSRHYTAPDKGDVAYEKNGQKLF